MAITWNGGCGKGSGDLNEYSKKDETVSAITRDGSTFTATRADGSTFTFDQQTYGAATTSESGLMAPAQVSKLNGISAAANRLDYTIVTGTSSAISIAARGAGAVICTVPIPAGYVGVGVVGVQCSGGVCTINNFGMGNAAQGDTAWRVDMHNTGSAAVSASARIRVLCLRIT